MFCKNCGKPINDNAVVCIHCGCSTEDNPSKSGDKESKNGIGILLGLFIGLIGLIIGIVMYKEGTVARQTFIKGWGIGFGITIAISVLIGIIYGAML